MKSSTFNLQAFKVLHDLQVFSFSSISSLCEYWEIVKIDRGSQVLCCRSKTCRSRVLVLQKFLVLFHSQDRHIHHFFCCLHDLKIIDNILCIISRANYYIVSQQRIFKRLLYLKFSRGVVEWGLDGLYRPPTPIVCKPFSQNRFRSGGKGWWGRDV